MRERPNGFIPDIRPRTDLGVDRDRTPSDLGSYSAQGTDTRLSCRRDGYIEFGGASYSGWSFAYGETPTKFRTLRPGDMFPSPSSGIVILRSSATSLGTVEVSDWSYAEGFVKALSGRASVTSLTSSGKYADPTGAIVTVVTTGVAAEHVRNADTISMLLKADEDNTAAVFVAETAAKATAAAGFELYQGAELEWWGPIFTFSVAAQTLRVLERTAS